MARIYDSTREQGVLHYVIPTIAWLGLLAGLSLPVFAPELANDAIIAILLLSLLHLFRAPQKRRFLAQPAAWMPLLACTILLVAFCLTAKSPLHVAVIFVFVHLTMIVPFAGVLAPLGRSLTLERISGFALLGALGGLIVAVIDVYVFGAARAGLVNNPIHLADLSLMVGFVALIGLWGRHPARWILGVAPLMSIATVVLTGSRGPLIAALPMALVAIISISLMLPNRKMVFRAFTGAVATLVLAVSGLAIFVDSQPVSPFTNLVFDQSTTDRLIMYEAAARAFLASPVAGYGLLDYVAAAKAAMPEIVNFPEYAHLHNDVADFAVAGGILGLIAYVLFLFAPLVGSLQVRGHNRGPMLYLGAVTTVGYFCMGMTNAMLGLRWQDIVLTTILAIIVVMSMREEAAV